MLGKAELPSRPRRVDQVIGLLEFAPRRFVVVGPPQLDPVVN